MTNKMHLYSRQGVQKMSEDVTKWTTWEEFEKELVEELTEPLKD